MLILFPVAPAWASQKSDSELAAGGNARFTLAMPRNMKKTRKGVECKFYFMIKATAGTRGFSREALRRKYTLFLLLKGDEFFRVLTETGEIQVHSLTNDERSKWEIMTYREHFVDKSKYESMGEPVALRVEVEARFRNTPLAVMPTRHVRGLPKDKREWWKHSVIPRPNMTKIVRAKPGTRRQKTRARTATQSAPGKRLPVCLVEGPNARFMLPDGGKDQYGNPVVTRGGQSADPATGLPYELWLKEPRVELVLIPAGEFMMGSVGTPDKLARKYNDKRKYFEPEFPRHRVRLTKPFYLAKYETTQGQWTKVMQTSPWSGKPHVREQPRHPAVFITWRDCAAFAATMSRDAGGTQFRLPTDAEWEYACRAGTSSAYCMGDDESQLADYAWYDKNAWQVGKKTAQAVGQKQPNAWGLYDMHGNVWEWCHDSPAPYSKQTQTDPVVPPRGRSRIFRGGSYDNPAWRCRSASRPSFSANQSRHRWGCRLAMFLPKPGEAATAPPAQRP